MRNKLLRLKIMWKAAPLWVKILDSVCWISLIVLLCVLW